MPGYRWVPVSVLQVQILVTDEPQAAWQTLAKRRLHSWVAEGCPDDGTVLYADCPA